MIMWLFRLLLRKKQSKGYGIHSPFAFSLITKTIYSPNSYYAFSDILKEVGEDPDIEQNQLSFRLVNHFKPDNILVINQCDAKDLLYILSSSADINCTLVEADKKNITSIQDTVSSFKNARKHYSNKGDIKFVTQLEGILHNRYDAIFIIPDKQDFLLPSYDRLFDLSNENTFWVIKDIDKKPNKHLWSHIVRDESVTITFDVRNKTGIAFLQSAYHKQHYYI